MKMRARNLFLLACAAPLIVSAAEKKNQPTVKSAYDKATEMTGSDTMTEVVFDKGGITLSATARSAIRDMLFEAQKRGKIAEVKILSWADKEYPVNEKNLPRDERRLADDRIYEIRNYIEENTKDVKVSTFNMAEKPDAMEEFIGASPNLKVKKAVEKAGLAHPHKSGMPPKASHAMVLVTLQ